MQTNIIKLLSGPEYLKNNEKIRVASPNSVRSVRAYMGGEYPKGGWRYSWSIRPSGGGDITRIFVPRGRYS